MTQLYDYALPTLLSVRGADMQKGKANGYIRGVIPGCGGLREPVMAPESPPRKAEYYTSITPTAYLATVALGISAKGMRPLLPEERGTFTERAPLSPSRASSKIKMRHLTLLLCKPVLEIQFIRVS